MTEKQHKKPITELDWTEASKSEMFERVILAVDSTRGEAEEFGYTNWMRYCEEQLFPFLEAEKEKAEREEAERDEDLRYLMSDAIGADEGEARLLLRDDDLWLLPPGSRYSYALDGEAGVRHWQSTARLARGLADFATNYVDASNPAITQLIGDACARAEEALRRAKARVEASE